MPMVSKRAAVLAGKRLNKIADYFKEVTVEGLRVCRLMNDREVSETAEAVRVANEVIYQYYCIPKDVREFWHQEVGADGIRMRDVAEE